MSDTALYVPIIGFWGTGLVLHQAWEWWHQRRARRHARAIWSLVGDLPQNMIDDLFADPEQMTLVLQSFKRLAQQTSVTRHER